MAALATYQDVADSLRRWRLWTILSWQDIRQRYRGSLLGPIWLSIGTAVTAAGLAFIFGGLFGQPWREIVAYIGAGLLVWTLITSTLNEASTSILGSAGLIQNIKLPLAVHLWRVLLRNFIIMLHGLPVIVLFILLSGPPANANYLLFLPGLLLVTVFSFAAGFMVAVLGVRYRDVPQLVAYTLQFMMFVTPIFWRPEQIAAGRALIVPLNPFGPLLIVARDPLLGRAPTAAEWGAALGWTALVLVVSYSVVAGLRRRVPLWL